MNRDELLNHRWFGKIPSDWEYKKLKFLTTLRSEKVNETRDLPYIGLENIESKTGSYLELDSKTKNQEIEGTSNKFYRNDVLFGKLRPYLAKCILADFEGICTTELLVMKVKEQELSEKYLKYLLLSPKFIDLVNSSTYGSKMPRANWEFIKNIEIPLPTLNVQKNIELFIENKIKEIDNLIIDKNKLIQLLEEKRQSMIIEAITKGLNPNAKMKDSGVEWIGEIPQNWNIKKIKYKFDIKKVIQPTEEPTVLSLTQKGIKVKDLNDFSGQHAESYEKYQRVEINDYVMNGMDLLTGYVDCAKFEGVTSPDYRVFRLKYPEECHDYYLRYFQICYFAKVFYGHGQGVSNFGRWRLQTDVFKDFPIPEPQIDEQFAISKYLAEKEIEINEAIEMIKIQIRNLKDYRQSLIYEAVTGRIDVRNFEREVLMR